MGIAARTGILNYARKITKKQKLTGLFLSKMGTSMNSNVPFNLSECMNSEPGKNFESKSDNSIFIYAETGVVFQGLVKSLERTFADIRITLSSFLPDAQDPDPGIGLVLLQTELITDLPDCIERCRICFPNASITLMINGDGCASQGLNRLFCDRRIQGLLPFTLKLDIWLAAIWLLLNGGEYYPYGVMQSLEKLAKDGHTRHQQPSLADGKRAHLSAAKPIDTLTLREHQILELLSEGLQNKTIADRLSLSDHTVKVHVHNLIRKLKVHNRTQAAAVYRNHIDHESLQSAFSWNTERAFSRNTEITDLIINI